MNKISIVVAEIGKDKGGIQNWMYFLDKFLNLYFKDVKVYAYKEDNFMKRVLHLAKSEIYFLGTWKMSIFILPFIIFTNRKIFVFIHGSEILELGLLKKLFSYLIRRKHTYIISNSSAIAKLFTQKTNRKVDIVQHPFLEINHNLIPNRENSIYKFCTISRLIKRKNIGNVIRAFYELKNKNLKFEYIIAGSGSEYTVLKKLVHQYGLEENILLKGKISEAQKATIYKASDYCLLPSIYDIARGDIEGYGIVFIEANGYGLPVLGGNTGGMVEAIIANKTGVYCDGTVKDIKNKIILLTKTKFDKNIMYQHALSHDYKQQTNFLDFIKEKIGSKS